MSRPLETVLPSTPIHDAAEGLSKHDVGALVVVDDSDQIEGLLTATDFVLIVRGQMVSTDETVAEFMRTDVFTTKRNAPMIDVIDSMLEHLIHHVPVVDGGEVIGMVTTMDLTASVSRSP